MAYWLLKTEPGSWSWQQQKEKGIEHWDGVRNYQASNNMKAMQLGDQCFFYHSTGEKRLVGIVEVVTLYYPDHTDESGRFGMVDVKYVQDLPTPVTLAMVKAEPELQHLALVKQARLSVMPIDDKSWQLLCQMGGLQ